MRALVARAIYNLLLLGRQARDVRERPDTSDFCVGGAAHVVLTPAPDAWMKRGISAIPDSPRSIFMLGCTRVLPGTTAHANARSEGGRAA